MQNPTLSQDPLKPQRATPRWWLRIKSLPDHPRTMFVIAPILLVICWTALFFLHQSPDLLYRCSTILERTVKEGTPFALLAIGAGIVLSTGGVDISTAGVATVGGVIFAALTQLHIPILLCLAAALLVGVISGALLGYGVHKNLPGLILSWAIGALWLIGSLVFADTFSGKASTIESTTSRVELGFPVASDYWEVFNGGFRMAIFCLSIVVIGISVTNLPRRTRAVGANRDSAIYAGIRSRNIYLAAYGVSGVLSAAGGVFWVLLNGGAQTSNFVGYELIAIAIAILGGTVMTGGYLSLPSIVAAAFFWVALRTTVEGANLAAVSQTLQNHVANGLFAAIFVVLLLPLGKRLSGPTQTISAEPKVQER